MPNLLHDFVKDEAGTTAVGYAMIVAIMAAAVLSAFAALGQNFPSFLGQVACMISDSSGCGSAGQ